jgi:hypothetical protein
MMLLEKETLAAGIDLHDCSVHAELPVPRHDYVLLLYSRSEPPPKGALPVGSGVALQLGCVSEGLV